MYKAIHTNIYAKIDMQKPKCINLYMYKYICINPYTSLPVAALSCPWLPLGTGFAFHDHRPAVKMNQHPLCIITLDM